MSDTPYDGLSPDLILDALESAGFEPSGGLLALNSFENRVYQIELNDGDFVVAKFYRPERWSDAIIREEHAFSLELVEHELPVVAPIAKDNETLFEHEGFRFAVFPRQGGYPPNLEDPDTYAVLARTLARLHEVGQAKPFKHRIRLSSERLGHESRAYLLEERWIPPDIEPAYESLTEHLLAEIDQRLPADFPGQRIHGDCHMGNVLWRGETPHFVDLDDCLTGPEIQDLWMLLSGEHHERQAQLNKLLDAYLPFHDLNLATIDLIEPLRTLRIMHHAAWIARRWSDPAFPAAFPWFDSERYWSQHVLELREQQAALQEPALAYLG
ncbi:MAG: serine/threonine protein kinase [Gammaproteobacteria bacterium]|jgi:Ser/Thr protein kinase RdoA (MazF antagonist)|nr:MAG: serine/threonine protein kinase [Gammaproteobacteria bacterium]